MATPFENIFNKKDNLETIYNFLKSEDGKLKKENIKKIIEEIEGIEYKEDNPLNKNKEENKNSDYEITDDNYNNFTTEQYNETIKNEIFENKNSINKTENNENNEDINENNNCNTNNKGLGEINFEEFQNYFNEMNSDKSNLKNVFLEGFAFLDRNK